MSLGLTNDEIQLKLRAAYQIAQMSDDKSTRNGALIVDRGWNVIHGFNHMLPEWGHESWHHERPFKYWVTEHAERCAILSAARLGYKTDGLTLVCNWVACPDCARAIVLARFSYVICHKQCQERTPDRWREMIDTGMQIMKYGGVEVIEWDGIVGDVTNLNNRLVWKP